MKKILSMILSLVLLLGCTAAAGEETAAKVPLGTVDINGAFTLQCGIPEGYVARPEVVTSDLLIATLNAEDPDKPMMTLVVSFDETYSDVERMNDLDADALALLEETFTVVDPTVEISYGETGLGTLLLIARQTVDEPNYISFLSVYKGYFIEFVLTPPEGAEETMLTDDQMRVAIDFLTDLDFIEADEAAIRARKAANTTTFTARIYSYDAGENTITASQEIPFTLMPESVDGLLGEGAEINLDGETVLAETVEKKDGDIIINDEYILRLKDDGVYHLLYAENDAEVLITVADHMTYTLTPDAVFLDYIDPESLEELDAPAEHSIEEFAAMLEAEGTTAVGPGFAADNVTVTIGEAGGIEKIERFYVPWQ